MSSETSDFRRHVIGLG